MDELQTGVEPALAVHDQIKKLLSAFRASKNPHTELITKVFVATDARWGWVDGGAVAASTAGAPNEPSRFNNC